MTTIYSSVCTQGSDCRGRRKLSASVASPLDRLWGEGRGKWAGQGDVYLEICQADAYHAIFFGGEGFQANTWEQGKQALWVVDLRENGWGATFEGWTEWTRQDA